MSERRGLILIVAVALAVGSAAAIGCGGDDDQDETATTTEQTTTAQTTTDEDGNGDAGAGAAIDPARGNPGQGRQVFADNCSSCHGSTGGGAASGPSLQDPDLADDPDAVVAQIVNGGGGMPPFGDQLSDSEIANVAAFVIEEIAQR